MSLSKVHKRTEKGVIKPVSFPLSHFSNFIMISISSKTDNKCRHARPRRFRWTLQVQRSSGLCTRLGRGRVGKGWEMRTKWRTRLQQDVFSVQCDGRSTKKLGKEVFIILIFLHMWTALWNGEAAMAQRKTRLRVRILKETSFGSNWRWLKAMIFLPGIGKLGMCLSETIF